MRGLVHWDQTGVRGLWRASLIYNPKYKQELDNVFPAVGTHCVFALWNRLADESCLVLDVSSNQPD